MISRAGESVFMRESCAGLENCGEATDTSRRRRLDEKSEGGGLLILPALLVLTTFQLV